MMYRTLVGTALAGLLWIGAAPAQAGTAVARIRIGFTDATLAPQDHLQITAQAVDKNGRVVPGAVVTYKSSKSQVLAVDSQGEAVAKRLGTSLVTARSGGKSASVKVVVAQDDQGGRIVAARQAQINHVVADEEFVYWTETGNQKVRIRRAPVGGGPIVDLYSEPAKDDDENKILLAQLALTDDSLVFTREWAYYYEHWSLRVMPKAGGKSREIIPADTAFEPLLTNSWRLAGPHYVIAVLAYPEKLGLSKQTVVAGYDLRTKKWRSLITKGVYAVETHLLAADADRVVLQTYTSDGDTNFLTFDPSAGADTADKIVTLPYPNIVVGNLGATDGSRVYYWTQHAGATPELYSTTIFGTRPDLLRTDAVGYGTVTNGSFLYWARVNGQVIRMPVQGGAVKVLRTGAFLNSTAGGLGLNSDSVFFARKVSGGEFQILKVKN